MSKKKTSKRLDTLFENVKKEDTTPEKRTRKNEGASAPSKAPLPSRTRTGPQTKTGATKLEESPAMATAISSNSGAMSLAFRTDEKSWATLRVIDEESPRAWAMEEQMLVKQVADQLSLALENARLFQDEQKRSTELQAISEIAANVSTILDFEKLLDEFVYQTRKKLNLYHAHIFILENDQHTLDIKACGWVEEEKRGTHGDRTIDIDQTQSLVAAAARTLQPVIANNVHEDANWLPNPLLPDIQSEMAVPVISKDKLIGVLNVHSDRINAFTVTDAAIVTTLASQIGTIIENARLFETTRQSQQAVADSEGELRALFSAMSDVIIVLDEEGRYVRIAPTNPSRLFLPPNEMLGKKVDDVLPTQVANTIMPAIKQALETGETIKIEYPLVINQTTYWFDGSISKLTATEVFLVARDITDRRHNELLQAAITLISEAALSSPNLSALLKIIHENVGSLMPAQNFYVALYDEQTDMLSFPYYADQYDTAWPAQKPGRGLTSYILQTGKALLVTPEIYDELEKSGAVKGGGTRGIDWLGAPLKSSQKRLGVIAVQSYDPDVRLTETDRDTLNLLAGQAAIAIERKRSQEELLKFKLGIDQSDDAVFMTDPEGTIIYANPGFERIYGFKPEEVIGQNPRILKSGLLSPEHYQGLWKTLLAKKAFSSEIVNKGKSGQLVPVAETDTPILDDNGNIIGFLAVQTDITERKHVEDALKRRNEYLAASAEIGRLVTSTLDPNTIFSRTVNLISERFGYYHSAIFVIEETGFNAIMREAVGPAAEEMKRQEHSLPVNEKSIVGKVALNGEPVIVNNTALDTTHKPNPLLPDTKAEAAIPLRVGSRIIGALDIQSTELGAFTTDDIGVLQILADQVAIAIDNARSYELSQQAVMEMREIDRLKSQFLANMSHELRTPLNSIIGFSRVILKGIDGAITELQQQDLTAIYNSGQHLLGLINDVLDLAKIEAGKMELAFDEVNIADLINSVASTTSGLIKDKPIKFVKNIQQDLPAVRADAIRVRQIMINLISNAAKFTEAGDIVLDAHLQPGPAGRAEILISVTDTGPGITEEDQAKLFQAFSQVDDSPTRKTGGTGLGLSISQQLVQMHGGQIGVHSVVGKGSTFYFTLPVYRAKDEPTQPGGVKVILAVDDDPQVISLYERYLHPQGYQVISVTDPTKAKERAKQLNPYAITLDIMMPGYDGWSVLSDLKSDADTREIPVVICSIIEEQERGFSLGAADYLLKPILEEDLLGSLDRLNADGSIREVLIIDDDPNSLRLMEKIFEGQGRYKTVLAEGGKQGWDAITKHAPQAVILDLFMPEMDGFTILEKMRENVRLRDVPVLVVSGGDLTPEQHRQLSEFGQRLVNKGSLNEKDFINNIERALKRAKRKK